MFDRPSATQHGRETPELKEVQAGGVVSSNLTRKYGRVGRHIEKDTRLQRRYRRILGKTAAPDRRRGPPRATRAPPEAFGATRCPLHPNIPGRAATIPMPTPDDQGWTAIDRRLHQYRRDKHRRRLPSRLTSSRNFTRNGDIILPYRRYDPQNFEQRDTHPRLPRKRVALRSYSEGLRLTPKWAFTARGAARDWL